MVSVGDPVQGYIPNKKKSSTDSLSIKERCTPSPSGDAEANLNDASAIGSNKYKPSWFARNHSLVRRLRLFALAALIFGWWISATILHATRHRWVVQTVFAWSFIAIIAFRFIPNSVVTRPVEAIWIPLVQNPFFALPRYARYGLGWLALFAIILGSAFGFELENVSSLLVIFFIEGIWPI